MNLPRISIIVTTYLEKTKPCLDLCMRSIGELNYPKELLEVILVGRRGYAPTYPGVSTVIPPEESFGNPRGLNFGIECASEESQYFFILNDDVLLTNDCLLNMIKVAQPDLIINPIELQPVSGNITPASSRTHGLVGQDHLCMFATLIPRLVYEKIGGFDERFKTGQDDIDYSWRAKQANVYLVLCLNSLVWHFGGTSANTTISNKMRVENVEYFKSKWGKLPPYVGEQDLEDMRADRVKWDRSLS